MPLLGDAIDNRIIHMMITDDKIIYRLSIGIKVNSLGQIRLVLFYVAPKSFKMKIVLILACLLAVTLAEESAPKCVASPTTASGSQARAGPYCSGDLIFEDNFNFLDLEKWEHENTLAGGGVSSTFKCEIITILIETISHRTGNSNGIPTTERILTAKTVFSTSVLLWLLTILAKAS